MTAEAQCPPRLVHKPEGREHAQHRRAFAHLQKKKIKDEKFLAPLPKKICRNSVTEAPNSSYVGTVIFLDVQTFVEAPLSESPNSITDCLRTNLQVTPLPPSRHVTYVCRVLPYLLYGTYSSCQDVIAIIIEALPLNQSIVFFKTQRCLDYFLHYFYFSMHKGNKSLMRWRIVYKNFKTSSEKVVFVIS